MYFAHHAVMGFFANSHNSRVLTMLPYSSKIKGYKGVITYVQK